MAQPGFGFGRFGVFNSILRYLIIAAAAILLAFNYHLFIVVNDFAPAGLNGIATMVQFKTGFSIGYMTLIINIPLCLASFFLIDRPFASRSLCFCLVYSAAYLLLQKVDLSAVQYDARGQDTVFPLILSGVISGLVYGICAKNSASTGGTDIVSKYISIHLPEWNFFYVIFAINAAVATASFFVYADTNAQHPIYNYKPVCLCILYCFISSFVGNGIVIGTKKACKFTVITPYAKEITKEISESLRHSSTQVAVIGSYDHKERQMLICVVNRHQIADFKTLLQKYSETFSFCETIDETYGNFNRVK